MSEPKVKKLKLCGGFSAISSFNKGLQDGPHFSMGLETLKVPMTMHAGNRSRVVDRMRAAGHSSGVVLMQGGDEKCQYDTDREMIFRQESYFSYLFGVMEPGWYGTVDLATGRSALFTPKLPAEYAVWQGEIKPPAYFQAHYAVDEVTYCEELDHWLRAIVGSEESSPKSLFLLQGQNSDSGATTQTTAQFPELKSYSNVNRDALHPILAEARVFKSAEEQRLMRYTSWITSMAHVEVMRSIRPGMAEYQLESLFRHNIYTFGGARHEAYTCICACGPNSATLHYGHAGAPNSRILLDGDMALLDMAAEYHCYCSDITCSYPVNGKFTDDQRFIFEGVLAAQRAVFEQLRPGTSWPDMHRLSWRVVLEHLVRAGILRGDVDELFAVGLGPVFLPCGLGHFIGCDTHDVGGYLPHCPPRVQERGIDKLRTARVLEEGMVLTVEPGIYFVDAQLDRALADPVQSKFIVPERLDQFRGSGGVRLEDVVVITAGGFENWTLCPQTPQEIESVMAGGSWPPETDEAPWRRRMWLS